MVIFHSYVNVYQRVTVPTKHHPISNCVSYNPTCQRLIKWNDPPSTSTVFSRHRSCTNYPDGPGWCWIIFGWLDSQSSKKSFPLGAVVKHWISLTHQLDVINWRFHGPQSMKIGLCYARNPSLKMMILTVLTMSRGIRGPIPCVWPAGWAWWATWQRWKVKDFLRKNSIDARNRMETHRFHRKLIGSMGRNLIYLHCQVKLRGGTELRNGALPLLSKSD